VQHDGGGMYRCVADNNVRPLATYDTNVLVFSRPRARAVQSSYGQAQNRLFDITFECVVSGMYSLGLQSPPQNQHCMKVTTCLSEMKRLLVHCARSGRVVWW